MAKKEKKFYSFKGIAVESPNDISIEEFEKVQKHLIGCEIEEAEFNALKAAEAEDKKRRAKKAQHLDYDYIPAIMKQFNRMRMEGTPMIQDMDDALGHYLQVEKDNQ